jgi:hypothetical protein
VGKFGTTHLSQLDRGQPAERQRVHVFTVCSMACLKFPPHNHSLVCLHQKRLIACLPGPTSRIRELEVVQRLNASRSTSIARPALTSDADAMRARKFVQFRVSPVLYCAVLLRIRAYAHAYKLRYMFAYLSARQLSAHAELKEPRMHMAACTLCSGSAREF